MQDETAISIHVSRRLGKIIGAGRLPTSKHLLTSIHSTPDLLLVYLLAVVNDTSEIRGPEVEMLASEKASLLGALLFATIVISLSAFAQPPACLDGTPHKKLLIPVDTGVQLQVLDWGGADKPDTMVLLTGLGDNAHVYDQFAFQFTDYFHVIGITRRGYPPSTPGAPRRTQAGYDVETRARDDIDVLDYLGITKAVFVGHSVAGSELSKLGLKYKSYVAKLVYLDAYDLSKRFQLPDIPGAPFTDADARSLQIYLAASERLEDILRPAQAVCLAVEFDATGRITGSSTPDWVPQSILLGVQDPRNPPVDWAKVEAPRLGIFDQPSVEGKLPYYWYLSEDDQKKFDTNWPAIVNWFTDTINDFAAEHPGTPKPIVYRLPDAPHYFYINQQALVVLAMREFLLGKVGVETAPKRLSDHLR
jgi:pimeloyl-ACP methyl ester carboxylesterase